MNILFVFWGVKGGGALYSYNICKRMSQEKPKGEFFISISRKNDYYDEFNKLNAGFFYIDGVHSISELVLYRFYKKQILKRRLVSFLKKHQIDTIILGMGHMISDVLVDAAKKCQTNLIPVIHEPTSHIGDFFLSKTYKNIVRRKLISSASGIVTLTESVKKELIENHSIPSEKIEVIKHGKFSYFKNNSPIDISDSPVINLLFFGRIEYYKGLDLLLEAFDLIGKKNPKLNLHIYGKGKIDRYDIVVKHDKRIIVNNNWISEEDITDIFKNAHICVLPYRKASQSGVVGIAIEAGVPIITTPIAGIVEQVKDSGAIITTDFSAESIAKSIDLLVNNTSLFKELSQNSINCQGSSDWASIAAELNQFCINLLKQHQMH
ncbi:MAG: glycosyltransferase family 4 protein [bacterium]